VVGAGYHVDQEAGKRWEGEKKDRIDELVDRMTKCETPAIDPNQSAPAGPFVLNSLLTMLHADAGRKSNVLCALAALEI
jgi:hypothetical protein